MQGGNSQQIIVYQQEHQQMAKHFAKRVSINEFKQINLNQIKNQFIIIQNSYTPNYNNAFHLEPKGKDRYSDIKVYKHNRIQIEQINNFYINASFMRSVLDNQIYAVFAQAPVKKVVDHFWYALYHYNIKKIVMLCAFEDPNRGVQAEKYWPEPNLQIKFSNVKLSIRCISEKKEDAEYIKTIILLKGEEGQKKVEHIHWTGWGDMRKPLGEKSQNLFQGLVKECLQSVNNKQLFLVHCSAGIGRTGTLGTMIEALRCAQLNKQLSVFQIVDNMRKNRMGCVQTFQQYTFIYQQLQKML